ncbi:MAG: peptidoglycan DD-metalloendopeptidase family protein [Candidatus Promineifilaceae bacterium]
MSSFKFEAWPSEYQVVTQWFGANPDIYAQFGLPGHDGIDIRAPQGSKIFSVAPGRVSDVQPVPDGGGWGIHVRVAHLDGYETIYAHLESALVRVGNRVQAGTQIGIAGSTGFSSGAHLHLALKRHGETYRNWPYNLTDPTPFIMPLLSWRKPAGPYTDGWVFTASIMIIDDLGQVNSGGAHLREAPGVDAEVIDLIPAGTIVIATGQSTSDSTQIRVPTGALDGEDPIFAPNLPASEKPLPPEGVLLGWGWEDFIDVTGKYGMVGRHGINLRSGPVRDSTLIGKVQWGKMVTLVGPSINGYAPLFIYVQDVIDAREDVNVQIPRTWNDNDHDNEEVQSAAADDIRGWVLTSQITIQYLKAVAGREGVNIRLAPRRNGRLLGYVPQGTTMRILGPPAGEYTPVFVRKDDVQLPGSETPKPLPDPDPKPVGQAAIGLHASADPDITEEEIIEFGLFRPSVIKVLSFHNPQALRQLVANHPHTKWIVRAFLDFGGRSINPQRFFNDTINDMQRTMKILEGQDVVIELHNEPNITPEGLSSSWGNGAEFSTWWLRLLRLYRYAFPHHKFIYPGLSPGSGVDGLRQNHVNFLEASRPAIEAADGLGVHIYWSAYYPMQSALAVLDDTVNRFHDKSIWITEASNNKNGTTPENKAYEYLTFWKELQRRPTVRGVTYFVASARNPEFQYEVFLGKGMSRIIGAR